MNIDIYAKLHQRILFIEYEPGQILKEMSDRLYALTFRLWYFDMLKMNTDAWNNETAMVKKELSELSNLLALNNPMKVGIARKKYLLEHLERIQSQFLGLSGNSHTYQ